MTPRLTAPAAGASPPLEATVATGLMPSVLADESGRRRRVLRRVGRAVSALLLLWLGVLALAALGIEPLGNLGLAAVGAQNVAPPVLPARVETAVAGRRVVSPSPSAGAVPGVVAAKPRGVPAAVSAPAGRRRRAAAAASGARPTVSASHPVTPQSPPGQATKTPPSTSARGKSTTSPGRTKLPRQTAAQPAPAAPGHAIGKGHTKTTTTPAP